jgi:hypothetical protein
VKSLQRSSWTEKYSRIASATMPMYIQTRLEGSGAEVPVNAPVSGATPYSKKR